MADGYAISVADVEVPGGVVLGLHPHPLEVLTRVDMQTVCYEDIFGIGGSTVCANCKSLTYGKCAVCQQCKIFICMPCYDRHSSEQQTILKEIVNQRHGTGSLAHRIKEERSRRIRTTAAVHENRQLPLIFSACIRGDLATVKEIIDKSCFSNSLDLEEICDIGEHKGATLLTVAARMGMGDIVELVLSRGAVCEAIDTRGMTPLMHAAFCGHGDVVDKLIFAGAVVDKVAICGYTALLFAANRGHALCVERLLAGGAKRTVRNPSGRTALIIAAINGHYDTVKLLITVVPPKEIIAIRDNEGYTALDAAVATKSTAIEGLLRAFCNKH
eukprot:GILI01027239.1.p1 GENE.GILI01027239.1~~GILI01027239.1.p1  ORF type:complete len:329 (-),score=23.09 GILI01027239.1:42-1028(-)